MRNEELVAEIQAGRRELLDIVEDPHGLQGLQDVEERIWQKEELLPLKRP